MAYPYYNFNPYQQNYYPATYQPMQSVQQPVQQSMQQAQPQQAVSQSVNTGRIWVNGKSEADFYPVAPNTAVDLWDRNGTTLYQKRADATGRPSIIVCDIVERAETASDGVSEQGDKLPAYATKDELSAVVGVVKGFDELIGSIKSDVEAMKGDLWGLAGSKKKAPAKKAEEATE